MTTDQTPSQAPAVLPWAPHCILSAWCVYAVYDGPACLWVDACPLHRLFEFRDLNRQRIYQEKIITSQTARVHVLATFSEEVEARRYQFEARRAFDPIGNRYFIPPKMPGARGSGAVKCLTTGQVFRNASEAARVCGCHATTMSNHLKRRPGYADIKSLVFVRVAEE